MAKAAKTYDAVAEVRKVRDRLAEELNRLKGPEERVAFLQKRLQRARERRAQRRQQQEDQER